MPRYSNISLSKARWLVLYMELQQNIEIPSWPGDWGDTPCLYQPPTTFITIMTDCFPTSTKYWPGTRVWRCMRCGGKVRRVQWAVWSVTVYWYYIIVIRLSPQHTSLAHHTNHKVIRSSYRQLFQLKSVLWSRSRKHPPYLIHLSLSANTHLLSLRFLLN